MKLKAVFVNAARSRLVDHSALPEALDSKPTARHRLDATDPDRSTLGNKPARPPFAGLP